MRKLEFLTGHGARWIALNPTDDEVQGVIEGLSDEDRAELFRSDRHALELSAAYDSMNRSDIRHLHKMLMLAELDGTPVQVSKYRMMLAAAEMGEAAECLVETIRDERTMRTMIESQAAIHPAP